VSILLLLAACGDDAPPAAPPPTRDVVADVRALQALLGDDLAAGAIEEVDHALDDDRPFLAEERLRIGAIPAARRMTERARAVETGTTEGGALRGDVVRAYADRADALERLRTALVAGEGESLELVEALGAQRAANEALLALHDRLAALRPLREKRGRAPGDDDSLAP
jgi:hypothetical protein